MKRLALLSLLALPLTGCINVPGAIKALSQDHSFTTFKVQSVWANVYLTRDGRVENGTEVSTEGAVKSIQPVKGVK